ncbi:phosphatidylinositol glycan class L [Mytilinidion resinicola]|uniref:N-acetylglucosaminylphosphatidylinositol deacetylase n=1 Tax=Mytilinidion resinicola TaxID=574789 RepID=A0A6A6YE85_9PEZI|nr:phosphatidylinositol glycan class L [Mytilinidion resinicola]KAF2806314.1 phosphatidylinositol glycan class L [Mytilinidion resinicola]
MNWVTWASVPILIFGLWIYTAQLSQSFPTLKGKRICLLIAHPDDEAMFFAPTLLALAKPELGNHIKILCLSSGNADGLGSIRKKELIKSGLQLGLRGEDDILIIDDPNFPDSMTTTWHPRLIADLLTQMFAPGMSRTPSTSPPVSTIDVLLTFDRSGISAHPNHISLHAGAHTFLRALMHRHAGWTCPIKLYTLTSVSILRKYLSVLDTPATIILSMMTGAQKREVGEYPTPLLYVSGPGGYRTAQGAMTRAHASQMRWFRWGWIGVGRYMVVNDLVREKTI